MNTNTEVLIRELAEKLGTTAEYLWAVLIRQAPVTGTTYLIILICWGITLAWAYKWIIKKTTKDQPKWDRWDGDETNTAWIIWGIVFLAFIICAILLVSEIINCFVNPEYWALMQILGPN